MNSLVKIGIGVGATVVLIGAWVGAKSFSGKNIGEECQAGSDMDCKGMSAQCLSSSTSSYCSKECNADKDCPSGWECGTIGITEIDGKGNIKKRESSMKMCLRGGGNAAAASASAAAQPSALVANAASASAQAAASAAPPAESASAAPSAAAAPASASAVPKGAKTQAKPATSAKPAPAPAPAKPKGK